MEPWQLLEEMIDAMPEDVNPVQQVRRVSEVVQAPPEAIQANLTPPPPSVFPSKPHGNPNVTFPVPGVRGSMPFEMVPMPQRSEAHSEEIVIEDPKPTQAPSTAGKPKSAPLPSSAGVVIESGKRLMPPPKP